MPRITGKYGNAAGCSATRITGKYGNAAGCSATRITGKNGNAAQPAQAGFVAERP